MDRTLQIIEKLVDTAPPLVSFETTTVDRALDLFKSLSLSHSSAFYQWSVEDGLHRLGASHIIIPRSRQPEQLLEYIKLLPHAGIFLLPGFAELLENRMLLEQFKQTLAASNNEKTVILVDCEINLPEELLAYTKRVRLGASRQQRKAS